jgi:glucose/arabinose dehydrogenase
MWMSIGGTVLCMMIVAQTVETRACKSPDPQTDTPPAPTPAPTPPSQVFSTRDGVRFRVETVLSDLEVPWALAFAPDGRLFVTERPGRVRIVNLATFTSEVALTLGGVYAQGEAGLLGIALDPGFSQNRYVYLYYSAVSGSGGVNRIERYREASGRLAERAVLLDRIPASTIHDGGRLKFGADGLLYATAGDAANTSFAQDVTATAGKILRITPTGSSAPDNRFGSPVFTFGHRNPQGFDWHPVTGEIWASEHGNTGNDEINLIRSGSNYGWPNIQGSTTAPGMEAPIAFYGSTIAPSGASFYRGQLFPAFANNLFVATLRGTHLLRLTIDGTSNRITTQERLLDGTYGRLRDVVSGPDGYLYFCTNNRDGRGSPMAGDDRILRIVPAS